MRTHEMSPNSFPTLVRREGEDGMRQMTICRRATRRVGQHSRRRKGCCVTTGCCTQARDSVAMPQVQPLKDFLRHPVVNLAIFFHPRHFPSSQTLVCGCGGAEGGNLKSHTVPVRLIWFVANCFALFSRRCLQCILFSTFRATPTEKGDLDPLSYNRQRDRERMLD